MTTETLDQALSRVWQHDWMHKRSGPTLRSQAQIAIKAVRRANPLTSLFPIIGSAATQRDLRVADVSPVDIREVTRDWYADGLSPATIQKRLNCLSKLGVNVEGCRVKVPKQLKWFLKEDDKAKVLHWCRNHPHVADIGPTLADFIEWTTLTGLRTEESLRLTWSDFMWGKEGPTVRVPGLKTASSQATLPLGAAANALAQRRFVARSRGSREMMFPTDYETLHEGWQFVREEFGWQDDPTATLKALRRSAARYLHIECGMPLHMVQQYLRHESMDTTLEYLRLTGGYGTEEMRRFLK